MKDIYLAGGCFWGVEEYFSRIQGIVKVESGYCNGNTENPTYEEVCTGITGFAECVHISYDPKVISLEDILGHYWSIIDPTLLNRQGGDIGNQYRTGIYYRNQEDRDPIQKSLAKEEPKYQRPIVTEVGKIRNYYRAEDYHQNYLKKNPGGYCHINLDK